MCKKGLICKHFKRVKFCKNLKIFHLSDSYVDPYFNILLTCLILIFGGTETCLQFLIVNKNTQIRSCLCLDVGIFCYSERPLKTEDGWTLLSEVFEAKNQLEIHCGKLFSYEGNLKKHIHTIHVLSLLMISIVNVVKHFLMLDIWINIYAIHNSLNEHL